VYQFVGDEAVISWKTKDIRNYENSIRLFWTFFNRIAHQSMFFEKNFETIPIFKGAIHSGKVMVAQVGGEGKTEIAYHGDVLNTAARMLENSKKNKSQLVISEQVKKHLSDQQSDFKNENSEEFLFRGKKRKIKVFSQP